MSDTPKQSLGPFELRGSDGPMSWDKAIFDADGNELLAYYPTGYDDRISLYDADWHLFAAAPEMLDALKEAVSYHANTYAEWRDEAEMEVYMRMKDAIAKAEGRQP